MCVCVYVVPPSHLCICACVRVFVCPPCVLVWVLLSDCHGLLTQTFTQLCSLVADLMHMCACVHVRLAFFLSLPDMTASENPASRCPL